MKLLRCLALMCILLGTCYGQLPDYYQSINRVTWISENIDGILPAWTALGMSNVHKAAKIKGVGTDHGKSTTLETWQASGSLGNLTVNFLQPDFSRQGGRQSNSCSDFLKTHKAGIFSVVHEVPSKEAMDTEIQRMAGLGVAVLQQVTFQIDGAAVIYTYFDTEPQGKYVVGLMYWPGGAPKPPDLSYSMLRRARIRDIAASRCYYRLKSAFNGWALLVLSGFSLRPLQRIFMQTS
jgi:hypothetical protein